MSEVGQGHVAYLLECLHLQVSHGGSSVVFALQPPPLRDLIKFAKKSHRKSLWGHLLQDGWRWPQTLLWVGGRAWVCIASIWLSFWVGAKRENQEWGGFSSPALVCLSVSGGCLFPGRCSGILSHSLPLPGLLLYLGDLSGLAGVPRECGSS